MVKGHWSGILLSDTDVEILVCMKIYVMSKNIVTSVKAGNLESYNQPMANKVYALQDFRPVNASFPMDTQWACMFCGNFLSLISRHLRLAQLVLRNIRTGFGILRHCLKPMKIISTLFSEFCRSLFGSSGKFFCIVRCVASNCKIIFCLTFM